MTTCTILLWKHSGGALTSGLPEACPLRQAGGGGGCGRRRGDSGGAGFLQWRRLVLGTEEERARRGTEWWSRQSTIIRKKAKKRLDTSWIWNVLRISLKCQSAANISAVRPTTTHMLHLHRLFSSELDIWTRVIKRMCQMRVKKRVKEQSLKKKWKIK